MTFVLILLAAGIGLGCAALLYARFIEPQWITVTRHDVRFPVRDLTIAVIGDFHVGPYKQEKFIARVAKRVQALKPDLIVLVGDFLFDHASDVAHLRPLGDLRAPLGVFAILGNHDSSSDHMPHHNMSRRVDRCDDLVNFLEPLGVTFLRNRSVTLSHRGEDIALAGTDDVWMDSCDLAKALRGIPADQPRILLSHNPDIILDPATRRANLILSGHTHGGQVRLPWLGAPRGVPQRLGTAFDRGIFTISPTCTLAITHGIGETHLPLRFFARPEILVLQT